MEARACYEIIEGVKYIRASDSLNHSTIATRIICAFMDYLSERNCGGVFSGGVSFDADNFLIPDVSIVCDLSIADRYGNINGAPDLCVEIISRSSVRRDRGKKKDIYERNGVKEYWIIDQISKSIEVYHLIEGQYKLDDVYQVYSMKEWEALEPEERAEAKFEIKVSLFDDLLVDVREVFLWWGESLPVYER
ncbi:MAG: Uma2 family endonuclease [Selenomonadaceae bacterium]|nr:Uma2 family endonuclease [Selenomonadaceae bacterium]